MLSSYDQGPVTSHFIELQAEMVRLGGNVEAALARLQSQNSSGWGAAGLPDQNGWEPNKPNIAAAAAASDELAHVRLGPPSSTAADGAGVTTEKEKDATVACCRSAVLWRGLQLRPSVL